MEPLKELLGVLKEKLEYTKKMIEHYEEGMDYATHCSLQGFAEGIECAMDEIKTMLKPKRTKGKRS